MAEDKDLHQGDANNQHEAAAGDSNDKPMNGPSAADEADKKQPKGDAEKMENGDGGGGGGGDDETPKENGDKASPEPPKDMRAIVLHGFGSLKNVKSLKRPEPAGLADSEVLIKVKACGVNFQDMMARQGALESPPKPPFVMGFECAGEIVQVGESVKDLKVGDEVVALPDHKAWAEYVTVPANYVYKLPAEMDCKNAAAITMNYTVAYFLLFEIANLTPGKSILLHGASGGVGHAIAQLAKTVENTTIFGVCSKAKHETLKSAGLIDHLLERGTDYSSAVRKEFPEGVDIVLDCLYGEECRRGYALLKPLGKYVLYGLGNAGESKSLSAARFWWTVDKVAPIKLYDENKSLSGFNLRNLMYQNGNHEMVQRVVNQVFKLWSEGKVKPVIDSTWALEDASEALLKMHEHKNIGKIILDLSLEPKPKPITPAKSKGKDKKNAMQEDKKSPSTESDETEKPKEPELTNGTSEEKSDSDSKEKESS
ncbi:synaptic vesicle membrane protein VAT-1 homolog-like [Copidosoma floridanum]|uniref:synaptic vesicle membrane protein VAT-1 homolog-like n=1 Tax=Copidosoma floridanum TaxID=29053 RepID=UPI0006C9C91C|nr:synaptic vesicle membrane protein VAT-1 homolog-like [Copidosoma floridanum]